VKNSKYDKQRLFEMMNKVAGMSPQTNMFSNLPPGFSQQDFKSLEQDIRDTPCTTDVNEDMIDTVNAKEIDPDKMQKDFKKKFSSFTKGDKQGIGSTGRIHSKMLRDTTNSNKFNDIKGNKTY
jgi:hypothetical protein